MVGEGENWVRKKKEPLTVPRCLELDVPHYPVSPDLGHRNRLSCSTQTTTVIKLVYCTQSRILRRHGRKLQISKELARQSRVRGTRHLFYGEKKDVKKSRWGGGRRGCNSWQEKWFM